MKSILIYGKKDSGKSTTMLEVCKRLKPEKVLMLIMPKKDEAKKNETKEVSVENIIGGDGNGTYIITIKGKNILIVAGATTEQKIRITIIIEICIELNIEIDFAIVAKRLHERTENFHTEDELEKLSEIILKEEIKKIPEENYKEQQSWKDRIDRIVKLTLANI